MKFLSCIALLCCIHSISGRTARKSLEYILSVSKSRSERQFPNLSFAVPAAGLFNNGNQNLNIFARSTVTRTVISTVSTVVVPSYRTCTVAPAVAACMGRRRRAVNEDGADINPTPEIKIIFDKTEITNPSLVAQILHLDSPYGSDYVNSLNGVVTDDALSSSVVEPQTALYPSEETTVQGALEGAIRGEELDDVPLTTSLPLDDDVTTSSPTESQEEDGETNEDPARAGFGGGTTVTTTIPVTAVVSTPVTAAMQTLTIMYGGCIPPGNLPITTAACV